MPVVWTVGFAADATVRAEAVDLRSTGSGFELVTPAGSRRVMLPLACAFNVSNALVAAGCALALGIDLETIARGLYYAPQVP